MTKFGLAQPVRRVEDPRLLKGSGSYTDDITLPGTVHGVVLRSPHAAAPHPVDRHRGGEGDARRAGRATPAPTSSADGIGGLPCVGAGEEPRRLDACAAPAASGAGRRHGAPCRRPGRLHRRRDRQARPRRRRGGRWWTTTSCPPSPTWPPRSTTARRRSGRQATRNVAFDWEIGDKDKTEALFKQAAHVTRLTVVNNRVVVASMEARAALAEYDAATGRWTLRTNTQGGWLLKDLLAGDGVQRAGGEVPRRHARRRRRLRHEALPLRRARAGLLRGAQARPRR